MKLKPLFRAMAIAATTAFAMPASAEDMKTLNFGIISTESTQNLKTIWDPFLEDMAKKLDMEVKAFFAPDYAGVIEAMRFDKVDVQTVDSEGNPGYWSLLVAHKDSPLNSLEDVLRCDKSLVFGNGDPNSTSGFLVPSYYVFAQNDVNPAECYKAVRNAGHETNAVAVANKQVDFATNNTENMRRLEKTKPEERANLKVLWQSPLIPSDPIVWRKNLPEDVKMRLKAFFLSYGRLGPDVENETKILTGLQWAPFRDSSNAQLYPIRQLQLFRDKIKLTNDERMDADEKAQKIAAIEADLAKLKILAAEETATD